MKYLHLSETDPPRVAPLTDLEARALNASRLAVATRTDEPGAWLVVPDRKVGALQIGPDLQVNVTPKVSIDRLVFMMGYARDPSFWRDGGVKLPREKDLPNALAHTFQRLATRAIEQGLLHGYRTVDESLAVVRGRIRTDDQLRLRYQLPLPVEVRYDDFTADIAENQILLTAVLRLLRMPQVAVLTRAALQRLRLLLADVTPVPSGTALPAWRPSRLNVRYHAALRTAELIIAASSFELDRQHDPRVDVSGFLFDAWKIFEDFCCVAMSEALRHRPGRPQLQLRRYLDKDDQIPIEPDFTWWDGVNPVLVVDAKYKVEKSGRFPNADTYQLLAYCTALGLDDGHLVYIKGDAQRRSYRVRRSPITVHCHTLDVASEPTELLTQVEMLASSIYAAGSLVAN